MEKLKQRIQIVLKKSGKKGVSGRDLKRNMHANQVNMVRRAIKELQRDGIVIQIQNRMFLVTEIGYIHAEIVSMHKTFGFAKSMRDQREYFIPGKFLKGALPGDRVIVRPFPTAGGALEGRVVSVPAYGASQVSGRLVQDGKQFWVLPDGMLHCPLAVQLGEQGDAAAGDKVVAKVVQRGVRHREHRVAVLASYGSADSAKACTDAMLASAGVTPTFGSNAEKSAVHISQRGIQPRDLIGRADYREQLAFTIDGADAKDLDDAIALEKHDDRYVLYVHIADVSHYVRFQTDLDREAFIRGTSIYFADQVIPMLPKALSNGICSLTPGEDRLTLTAVLTLGQDGKLLEYQFQKGVICSRIKGVYDEINQLFAGQETAELAQKYHTVRETLTSMKQLADILTANRRHRGAPDITTVESKLVLDQAGEVTEIVPRITGAAQRMIEEFMLTANEAAATMGMQKDLPFLYRIHPQPSVDKLLPLNTLLRLLGLYTTDLTPDVPPKVFAEILDEVRGTDLQAVVNHQILRTMCKASYAPKPMGHYGLALKNYTHFTSPIRRYPDLVVHRILSDVVSGDTTQQLDQRYEKYVMKAGKQSTHAEINAMRIERECEGYYKAEYMLRFIGQEFDGLISAVAPHGLYVVLQNTVEGLVPLDSLPGGPYDYDGMMEYRSSVSGGRYRIGDRVRVQCVKADVNNGRVDFALASQ